MAYLYTSPEEGSAAVASPDAEVEVVGLGLAAAHGAHLGAPGPVVFLRGGPRHLQLHRLHLDLIRTLKLSLAPFPHSIFILQVKSKVMQRCAEIFRPVQNFVI